MIIDYDHNQNITEEQRLKSLKESVQMALNDVADKSAGQDKAASDFKEKTEATLGDIQESIEQILERLGEDFVTETGTSGIWSYRKWNSGVYEADGYYEATGLNITSASAGTYYGGSKTIALPSFHSSLIACTNGATSPTSSGVYVYRAYESSGSLAVEYRAHTSSSNSTCGTYLHIVGQWS